MTKLGQKVFRTLLTVEAAKSLLYAHCPPAQVGTEIVPLECAHNRVLAQDVEAKIDVPPFDKATMDGYAVYAEDTFMAEEDEPAILKIIGKAFVGENTKLSVERGKAIEISTGAPVPRGANAVVMVEYTDSEGDVLNIYRPVGPGENVIAAGSDIRAGELILRKGTLLTPRETGILAALGIPIIDCYMKPRVAILSSGNELIAPGKKLDDAKIFDINARSVSDSVTESGGKPLFLGIARDTLDDITLKIREGFKIADIVIASGGTSAGIGDLVYQVLDKLGKPGILVHGVSVRPGKPTIIGGVKGKPFFGLPGNPTSALMIFDIFVRPTIRAMAGLMAEERRRIIDAKTAQKIYPSEGRREYLPVNIVRCDEEGYMIYPVLTGSGAITTLAEADGFIEIPENRRFLKEGETVKVNLFSETLKPADLMIIGSHCVGVDLLLNLLSKNSPNILYKTMNTGSSSGLSAIRRGEADVSGIHLLDEGKGEYNLPFLKRFEVDDKAVLIRGYNRQQGLIVARNNPRKITSFMDLLRHDITLINRNAGSGTRILLDFHLNRIASQQGLSLEQLTSSVNGYSIETKSHAAVAVAILRGKADVGLGIETVAEQYHLDFIPLLQENYDFVVRKDRMSKNSVKAFLDTLRSEDFKEALKNVRGLSPTDNTGNILYQP
ncbi:MAG TPA: molybdopterin biosynthesis protein [Candidatus Bathyarchaeia archaeon]|nr:molybdopterin biosynthesis protein [Candidatus Bathyarchaeia archaeon]